MPSLVLGRWSGRRCTPLAALPTTVVFGVSAYLSDAETADAILLFSFVAQLVLPKKTRVLVSEPQLVQQCHFAIRAATLESDDRKCPVGRVFCPYQSTLTTAGPNFFYQTVPAR